MATHHLAQNVSLGDCDPVGIVFYPHFFAWFDRCFHDWLRRFGGHESLCARLNAVGLGLMSADAAFRAPARDGDALVIGMEAARWGNHSLTLSYTIRCGTRLVATGTEIRGLFLRSGTDIIAGDLSEFRGIVGD